MSGRRIRLASGRRARLWLSADETNRLLSHGLLTWHARLYRWVLNWRLRRRSSGLLFRRCLLHSRIASLLRSHLSRGSRTVVRREAHDRRRLDAVPRALRSRRHRRRSRSLLQSYPLISRNTGGTPIITLRRQLDRVLRRRLRLRCRRGTLPRLPSSRQILRGRSGFRRMYRSRLLETDRRSSLHSWLIAWRYTNLRRSLGHWHARLRRTRTRRRGRPEQCALCMPISLRRSTG